MAKCVASSVLNINDFPDEILSHIISSLPTKEAVRASSLSRRWRHLYTLLSNVDLDVDCIYPCKWERFVNFLDVRVFSLDIPIVRFRLRFHIYIYPERVSALLPPLEWHKVQELDLWTDCTIPVGFRLPENLFSWQSLVVLKLNLRLDSYELKIPDKICLPELKVLHFKTVGFTDDGFVERLFSSCPVLEELELNVCWFGTGCPKFIVSNPNLKSLTLQYCTSTGGTTVPILIIVPNLIFLSYSLSTEHSLELVDTTSLAKALISFQYDAEGNGSGYIAVAPGVLRQIQNIKTLEIHNAVVRDLQRSSVPIPLFDMMTCLKIWKWEFQFDLSGLKYFLARCVVLETLVLLEPNVWPIMRDTSNQDAQQRSQMTPSMNHLKTVEFHLLDVMHAEDLMPEIKFFLDNASVLEELKIHCKQGDSEQKVKIMEKFSKSFKAVQVSLLIHYGKECFFLALSHRPTRSHQATI